MWPIKMERARTAWLLGLWLILAACAHGKQPASAGVQSPGPAGRAPTFSAAELRLLDAVSAAEAVFPDPAQRSLYKVQAPVTEGETRAYGFELLPQPGMDPTRHYQLIAVTYKHATGTGLRGEPVLSGTGGPNGSMVEAAAQTADGVFEVRVSVALLLPDIVSLPPFDPKQALIDVLHLHRYFTSVQSLTEMILNRSPRK